MKLSKEVGLMSWESDTASIIRREKIYFLGITATELLTAEDIHSVSQTDQQSC